MPTITKSRHVPRKTRKPKVNPPAIAEVGALRRKFGLSQGLLARLLDVSLRSVSAVEGVPVVPAALRRNLTQISRLCEALADTMQPSYAGTWLDHPNEMLAGLKPVEAIERGRFDLVWQVVNGLRTGSSL